MEYKQIVSVCWINVIFFNLFTFLLVWSLGCVLYSLITLSQPYSDIGIVDQDKFISQGKRPSLSSYQQAISFIEKDTMWPKLLTIFEHCTTLEPQKRPTSQQIIDYLKGKIDLVNISESIPIIDKYELEKEMESLRNQLNEALRNEDFGKVVMIGEQLEHLKSKVNSL